MTRNFSILALLLALAAPALADLPSIRLTSVFPPGARAGTVVEVTVVGEDLDDLSDLRFSYPGLFAKPATDSAGKVQPNRFVVAVSPGVPPGAYDVRAAGRFGVSSPRAFAVSDQPELVESAGNDSLGGATEVQVGSVVNGVCAGGVADYFRFAVKAGQRVIVGCAAREIDSRAEPVLTLTDPAGRDQERSRTGGVLDFIASADGVCVVRVHDVTFRGGPAFFYRLSVSAGPHVDFVVPPAGRAGTRGRFVLYGRNLPNGSPVAGATIDGKALVQLPVEIDLPASDARVGGLAPVTPARASARAYEYRLRTERGTSNPVLIALTDEAAVPEGDDNDQPDRPTKLTAPGDVAGQFFPGRDKDWFSLDAKKGDVWRIDVWSNRLGVLADPFLLVQRVTKSDKGETQSADVQEIYDTDANAGGADFNTSTRDPSYRLEAKEDSAWRLQVRDLFNTTREDPRLAYVLSVRKEKPDFSLLAVPVRAAAAAAPVNPLLRKGGAVPMRVIAVRRDGFDGVIALSAEGLPPGVSCAGATIAAGSNAGALVLVASDAAAAWAGPIRIIGKADVAGAAVVREAAGACVVVNAADADAARSRLTGDFQVAVGGASDVSPVSFEPGEAKTWEAPVGGKVSVPLKFTWRADASGKFKLKAAGHPSLDNFQETEIDAKAAAANVEIDLNKHKLPPGTHTLYVRAEGKVKYTRNPEATKAAGEARAAAEKVAADAAAALKVAAEKLAAVKAAADAEATKSAEKAAAEADAASKAAEQKKTEAGAKAKELEPKDIDGVFYSIPIIVKVVAPVEKK